MLDRKTDDPQDIRRVEGMDRSYQPKTKNVNSLPSVKSIVETQMLTYDDNGTIKFAIRRNGKLYAVELTEL